MQDKNLGESRRVVVNSQCHICHIEYYLHILPANETIKVLKKKTHHVLGKMDVFTNFTNKRRTGNQE